ncbi:MAG: cell division protein ZapA [Acidaminococcales bacterium]|jgi:cell division protein ZapA|nr:cell division protein ZapA [Acidaminococcales bacterium]
MDKQRIIVNIFNEQYALKADLSEEKVQELAEYVDSRMRRIASMQPAISSAGLRVAVLAALELADEAINGKEAYEGLLAAIKEEMSRP